MSSGVCFYCNAAASGAPEKLRKLLAATQRAPELLRSLLLLWSSGALQKLQRSGALQSSKAPELQKLAPEKLRRALTPESFSGELRRASLESSPELGFALELWSPAEATALRSSAELQRSSGELLHRRASPESFSGELSGASLELRSLVLLWSSAEAAAIRSSRSSLQRNSGALQKLRRALTPESFSGELRRASLESSPELL
jgi:hypothetical protein